MNKLSVGMVGVGNFGAARRKLMRQAGVFQVIACYDSHPQRLAEACAEEGAHACDSFAAVLRDPQVQAVVISTGATSHAELAEQAMRAGKHVFVEKPLCCSVDEVRRLRAAQQASGCVVGVGHHQNDSDPHVLLVRRMVEDGSLGKIAAYEENSSHSGGFQIRESDWRGEPERNPGGMLFQCGVHALHQLNALFGPVTEVQASFRNDVNQLTRTADVASCILRHQSGVLGTLNCYHVTAYCHELRVFGTKGNLYIDTFEHRAWYQKALYGPREPRVEVPMPDVAESETANLMAWHDAIRGVGQANPSLDDGIAALLPIFAAERAAREQRLVRVLDLLEAPAAPGERDPKQKVRVSALVRGKRPGVCQ